MEDRLKVMEQDIKELIKAVAELPEKILEKADSRYAPISVAKWLYWTAGILFTALVGIGVFVIEFIIKK